MSHVYCPECGFQNPAAANYCSKCGALLAKDEQPIDQTMTYTLEDAESGELAPPDCDIFLDDVTVSRRHAVLIAREGEFYIEDQGSLNGTFLNRQRIDSSRRIEDGDELQIGKYRLTFLSQ